MKASTKYVLNLVFNNIDNPEKLKQEIFSAAVAQIEVFEKLSTVPKQLELYLSIKKSINEMQEKSSEEINGNKVHLKIPIISEFPEFDEIYKDGRRLWLREFIESNFLKYVRTGLLDKTYSIKDKVFIEHLEYEKIYQSFDESMSSANQKVSPTFWIDGE